MFFVFLYSMKWPIDRRQDLSVESLIFRCPLRLVGLLLFVLNYLKHINLIQSIAFVFNIIYTCFEVVNVGPIVLL